MGTLIKGFFGFLPINMAELARKSWERNCGDILKIEPAMGSLVLIYESSLYKKYGQAAMKLRATDGIGRNSFMSF